MLRQSFPKTHSHYVETISSRRTSCAVYPFVREKWKKEGVYRRVEYAAFLYCRHRVICCTKLIQFISCTRIMALWRQRAGSHSGPRGLMGLWGPRHYFPLVWLNRYLCVYFILFQDTVVLKSLYSLNNYKNIHTTCSTRLSSANDE